MNHAMPPPPNREPANAAGCNRCGSHDHLVPCNYCKKPVCPSCRAGVGGLSDGYTCAADCTLADFLGTPPPVPTPPPPTGVWAGVRQWLASHLPRFS